MYARRVRPPQDHLQLAQAEATLAVTIAVAHLQGVHHQAAATTVAVLLREVPLQAQAAVLAAAIAAEAAAQVRVAATPAQAVTVRVVVAAQAAEAEAAVLAVEEDKKIRPESNKKTTFAASLQGSLLFNPP